MAQRRVHLLRCGLPAYLSSSSGWARAGGQCCPPCAACRSGPAFSQAGAALPLQQALTAGSSCGWRARAAPRRSRAASRATCTSCCRQVEHTLPLLRACVPVLQDLHFSSVGSPSSTVACIFKLCLRRQAPKPAPRALLFFPVPLLYCSTHLNTRTCCLTLQVMPSNVFERDEFDLIVETPLDMVDAALGTTIE